MTTTQHMIRPGLWMVEGYRVQRVRTGGIRHGGSTAWVIWRDQSFIDSVSSLSQARQLIQDREEMDR